MVVFCCQWILPAALLLPVAASWYWGNIPALAAKLAAQGVVGVTGGRLEILARFLVLACACSALLVAGTAVVLLKPASLSRTGAAALVGVALVTITGGEPFREMARKPWVIYGVLYSNSMWADQARDAAWLRRPFLEKARWRPDVAPSSNEHGAAIFKIQCASCHTREMYRSLEWRTRQHTGESLYQWLATMDASGVMPPFSGDQADRAALASYLLSWRGVRETPADILEKARKRATSAPPEETR